MIEQETQISQLDSLIKFGPSVRFGTFSARNISEGNFYVLSPIKVSDALSFLRNPGEIPGKTKFKDEDPSQLTVFSESSFDEPRLGNDLPSWLYDYLKRPGSTLDNVSERLRLELSEEDALKYSTLISSYFEKLPVLGPQTNLSNKPFGLSIYSVVGGFKLEGERKSKSVEFAGRFDEIRKGEEKDTIIRIRQKKGQPSILDAIHLGLDKMAYQAANKKRRKTASDPNLMVFNLVDGKTYNLEILYQGFYREIINALILSHLSMEAGYYPEDQKDGLSKINTELAKRHSKNVELFTKHSKTSLTAEEIFKRAQNCIKRLRGELPHTNPLFKFTHIN